MTKRERIEALEEEVQALHLRVAKLERASSATPVPKTDDLVIPEAAKPKDTFDPHEGCRGCQLCEWWRCQD